MSFLDKAKDLLGKHDEQVDQALEHGGGLAKDRFAGHDGQIDGAVDRAQEMTGEGDTVPDQPPPAPPAAPAPQVNRLYPRHRVGGDQPSPGA